MQEHGVCACIVPGTDPHASEYMAEHWTEMSWITGFLGETGTAVITLDDVGLWTDSRYFLQAANELEGSGIRLFKDKLPETPSITDWLGSVLNAGELVGIDGWVNTAAQAASLREELAAKGLTLTVTEDPFNTIWEGRPCLPKDAIFLHDIKYAGISCTDKIAQIQEKIKANGSTSILISALDDIAWTLNLRGCDVHCNPIFISYLLITPESNTLYIIEEKVSDEVRAYLQEHHVDIRPYDCLAQDLKEYKSKHAERLQVSTTVNETLYSLAVEYADAIITPSPVGLMKSYKNAVEIEGFRRCMERDGVAMVKFIRWVKEAVKTGNETEMSADKVLCGFRAEQALFKGISFDTIAGYKEHAALPHHKSTPENDMPLKPEGLFLVDSGGQYLDGTTDITRTIALGPLTDEEKADFTLVLKGHLQIQNLHFPQGTCGTQLDAFARIAMWKCGINYLHGTGHGVGQYLCVHEGPHQFRMNHMPTLLEPGMNITNEPGIYKAGKHGARTENVLLVVPAQETEFGKFYKFEPLTMCPIDKEAIVVEMMTDEELTWFNEYHQTVYDRLNPYLNTEEQAWLKEATAPLKR
jgi:Xaa-Pro aminopeptidase